MTEIPALLWIDQFWKEILIVSLKNDDGAYAIGATKGFFYIRAEYPLAIKRIRNAIKQAKEAGLMGEKYLRFQFLL
jgi:hypothetical protein